MPQENPMGSGLTDRPGQERPSAVFVAGLRRYRAHVPTAAELRAHLDTLPLARALFAELSEHRARRAVDVAAARLAGITVVLENISDPHNASAVLRTCEGLGVATMHVVEQPNRWEKNKAIARSADDWITVARHQGLARCLGDLSAGGFALYAADVGSGCVSIADVDVTRPVALVFGSEHSGLSKRALALTDHRFTIPMHGMVESFNVSVSAAVALWELTSRRRRHLGAAGDLALNEAAAKAITYLKRAVKNPELVARLEDEHSTPTSSATGGTWRGAT
jgi:tRNA (guanosine-2'-O-)-methyltransferase